MSDAITGKACRELGATPVKRHSVFVVFSEGYGMAEVRVIPAHNGSAKVLFRHKRRAETYDVVGPFRVSGMGSLVSLLTALGAIMRKEVPRE